jgi:hypothetical protein
MLHESPPQQQHSCWSDFMSPLVVAPSFFIEHESPQQHSCLSDFVAPLDVTPSFFIEHESPQQHDDMQQHDSDLLLGSVCVAVCANATPAIARESPSKMPEAKPLKFFISILLQQK